MRAVPVRIYSRRESGLVARAGAVLARALERARACVRPGVTGLEIEREFTGVLRDHGATSALRGHAPPGATPFGHDLSVGRNRRTIGAAPDDRALDPGDLVTLDGAVELDGWHADAAVALACPGAPDGLASRLADGARFAMNAGLAAMGPGVKWSAVAGRISSAASDRGRRLVAGLDGHGVGRRLHEPPRAWSVRSSNGSTPDFTLLPGMILTVEPAVCEDIPGLLAEIDEAGAAHAGVWMAFEERTVAITHDGADVLTPFA